MIEVIVPRENVNDDSVIVRTIHFDSGVLIKKGQLVVVVETSKTNIDIESPDDGILNHNLVVGDEIEIGKLLFKIGKKTEIIEFHNSKVELNNIENIISNSGKKRANELGIPLGELGSGWINAEAVEKKAGVFTLQTKYQHQNSENISESRYIPSLTFTRVNIPKRKQTEIKNLEMGNHHATSSTIGIEIKLPGERIISPSYYFINSISDLVVYEGSKLLKKFSDLNAFYIDSKLYGIYEDINFGWSFDNGSNLKVLTIKNSDKLSLLELHQEIDRLILIYESDQNIPIGLLNSSTVTISDLSKNNAAFILPLINGYQSLILGVVSKENNHFSIFATFDHRILEGLVVTKFLAELKSRILSYFYDRNGNVSLYCCACEKTMSDEFSLGHRGFIKLTTSKGEDVNICRNCFDGW